eukprot:GFUD01001351.1.p1 GENE.GFUD01001351.1~~GFUD01001351.1.p1  ORF type:complete len:114 (+),score=25.95 GFUD01001351.1:37-342(+)
MCKLILLDSLLQEKMPGPHETKKQLATQRSKDDSPDNQEEQEGRGNGQPQISAAEVANVWEPTLPDTPEHRLRNVVAAVELWKYKRSNSSTGGHVKKNGKK